MLKELEYPFDAEYILKKSRALKRRLLEEGGSRIRRKIAVLGGSTTHDIVRILELFLLNQGIEPVFYESEYGQFWEDAMFGNEELQNFAPDIVYIHTSNRNIRKFPGMGDSAEQIAAMLEEQYLYFERMWEKLWEQWHCPVIQNNFEQPFFRLMGNKDCSDIHGRVHYLSRLNERFYEYAQSHDHFYINDINYQSAVYGLDAWADPFYWHMYKYALCLQAIPWMTHNLANIIKSIYGKNKKSLVLDLDHTLWGGVVGDDGAENLEIGQETSLGQVYAEFQTYVKALKEYGVMLNVASKNEEENALAGLNHPDGILRPDDFILIKANWEPKSKNIAEIAQQMNILPDSLVFADDNPAEREIVMQQVSGVQAPDIGKPEAYIRVLDHGGYFEVTSFSEDDRKRNEMYQANAVRAREQASFADYGAYLQSLQMTAQIRPFEPLYLARIAQLTNKSNQFNLTTQRFTQAQLEQLAADGRYLTLYGRLQDKFGDNGLVTVVIGEKEEKKLHLRLWLMSCRVLKRDMEFAMMDEVVRQCREAGITEIFGYYYPTAKNAMVKEFYAAQGFAKTEEDAGGNTVWRYQIPETYELKNKVITVNKEEAAGGK